jgi:hypothetical protein
MRGVCAILWGDSSKHEKAIYMRLFKKRNKTAANVITLKQWKPKVISRSWAIEITVPNERQTYPHYGQNLRLGVVAPTMEEAIALVRQEWPVAVLHSVHNRGDVHVGSTVYANRLDQPK